MKNLLREEEFALVFIWGELYFISGPAKNIQYDKFLNFFF